LDQITISSAPNHFRGAFLLEREKLQSEAKICYQGGDSTINTHHHTDNNNNNNNTDSDENDPNGYLSRHQNGLWINKSNRIPNFICYGSISSVFPFTSRSNKINVCAFIEPSSSKHVPFTSQVLRMDDDKLIIRSSKNIVPLFTLHIRPITSPDPISIGSTPSAVAMFSENYITKEAKKFLRRKKSRIDSVLAAKTPYSLRVSSTLDDQM